MNNPSVLLSPAKQALLERRLRGERGAEPPETLPIPRRDAQLETPLTFQQQRLWFLDQLVPGSASSNVDYALRFEYPLNVAVMRQSVNELVRRHEVLRTRFATTEGGPVQLVVRQLELDIPVLDLSGRTHAEREAEVGRLATVEARTPFDLGRAPLLRVKLLRLSDKHWVMLVTMHHIVSDGWSMRLLFQELRALYDAFAFGKRSPLPELTIQYGDYAVWQRRSLTDEALEKQLGYWRQTLANLPRLELPTDHPRPRLQRFAGATYIAKLTPRLTEALRALSQREGVTTFMLLLAGFQTLLMAYTRQTDVVVGSYVAGRTRSELEQLIGFFVNTLVLRSDLGGDPTFSEALKRVREVALGAFAHQDVPFEKLVEELAPHRDLSRNPLCQVAFQMFVTGAPRNGGSSESGPSLVEVERGTASFDLVCNVVEHGETLTLRIEYNTDLFEAASVLRLCEHYQALLAAVAAKPHLRLSEIELLTDVEQSRLAEWNAAASTPYPDEPLAQVFESVAQRHGDREALRGESGALRYDELNRQANRLAHHLRDLGVREGSVVGVHLSRSLEVTVVLLAILKAGGVYLPLDASYPSDRLEFIAVDANARLVVTSSRWREQLTLPVECQVLCLDEAVAEIAGQIEDNLGLSSKPSDLAYLIYTSGSTGKPKGVAVEHRQLLNRFAWMSRLYPFAADEVSCQRTPLSFVDSLWELLGPLLAGSTSVVVPDRTVVDVHAFVDALASQRVTRLWVVPSLLRAMLDTEPELGRRLPSLRFWVSSGEPLDTALLQRFRCHVPDAKLFNLYGASEVWDATWYDTSEYCAERSTIVPIGRPIQNVQTYVLDAKCHRLPIGMPGELCIGGAGVARGYIGHAARDDQRFAANPFDTSAGALLYRTGDRARFLHDGQLELLGRFDHQAKIRGVRVELSEVELALLADASVSAAAVVVQADEPTNPQLVAYVVPACGSNLTVGRLRQAIAKRLPEAMLPGVYIELDALPLTPNGKLDRAALPSTSNSRPTVEAAYVAPSTPFEQLLATIWADVIGVDRVGLHDNFFELGGHSLLLTQVASRVRSMLHIELPLRVFFEAPTVASLAEAAAAQASERAKLERAAELVLSLLRLSNEEVEEMLRERRAQTSEGSNDSE